MSKESFNKFLSPAPVPDPGHLRGGPSHAYNTSCACVKKSSLLRRVLDIYCQIDSSQCLAQLTPAMVGKARSVHVQLGEQKSSKSEQ